MVRVSSEVLCCVLGQDTSSSLHSQIKYSSSVIEWDVKHRLKQARVFSLSNCFKYHFICLFILSFRSFLFSVQDVHLSFQLECIGPCH